jgi:pilus assembly protein CpaB
VKRRVLSVALALLLAVAGTGAVLAYVRQADNRALAGQKAVSVLVAENAIPSGTSASTALSDGLLSSQKLPAAAVPADAVASITPDLSGLVVSAEIQAGQLLLRPMLVTAAQVTGSLGIPAGMQAVTLELCMPEAVANNLHAGSKVAVFDTYAASSKATLTGQYNCQGPHEQQAYGSARIRLVLPSVLVLSAWSAGSTQSSSSSSSGSSSGGALGQSSSGTLTTSSNLLVTFAVSQANAERLILLTETGLPYLTLLTSSSQGKVTTTTAPPPAQP